MDDLRRQRIGRAYSCAGVYLARALRPPLPRPAILPMCARFSDCRPLKGSRTRPRGGPCSDQSGHPVRELRVKWRRPVMLGPAETTPPGLSLNQKRRKRTSSTFGGTAEINAFVLNASFALGAAALILGTARLPCSRAATRRQLTSCFLRRAQSGARHADLKAQFRPSQTTSSPVRGPKTPETTKPVRSGPAQGLRRLFRRGREDARPVLTGGTTAVGHLQR